MSFPPMDPMEFEEEPETPPLAPTPPSEVDYTVRLSDDDLKALGRRVCREVEHYDAHVRPRMGNAQEWRAAAALMPDSSQDLLGDASAGIRASDTRRVCQAHTTRLDAQILGSDPYFTAEPLDAEAVESIAAIEEVVSAYLDDAEFATDAHLAHKELPIVSPLAVRVQWKTETARRPKHSVEVDEQVAMGLAGQGMDPMTAMNAATVQDDAGRAKVFFEFEDRVVRDGLDLCVIPFEDLIMLPATAKDPEGLWAIGERVRLRGMDLKRGAKEGVYLKEQVEEVLKTGSAETSRSDRDKGDASGMSGDDSPSADDLPRYREYACVELAWKDDLDDDGYEEWYLLTVDTGSERVIRCQYLPYDHGKPHYVPFPYDPEAGKLWGMSIAELMAVPQDAMSAAKNAFFNLLTLMVADSSSGMYEVGSGFDPDDYRREPGSWVPVNNIQGVHAWPITPGIPQTLQAILAYLEAEKGQVDLLTAASDTSLGKTTDSKTLGEVELAYGQSQQQFEGYATSVSRCWSQVFDLCRHLVAQYGADEAGMVGFRKKAEAGKFMTDELGQQIPVATVMGQEMPAPGGVVFHQVPVNVLAGNVKIKAAGYGIPDANTRVQRDLLLLQTLSAHPLTAQDWKTQAILIEQLLQDTKLPQKDKIIEAMQAQIAMLEMQAMMAQQMAMQQAGTQQAQAEQDMALKGQEAERGGQQAEMDQYGGLLEMAGQEMDIEDRMKGKPPAGNGAKKK